MRYILLVFFVFQFFNSYSQKNFKVNPWVGYNVDTAERQFRIEFIFRDNKDKPRTISLRYPVAETRIDINRFGIPATMFDKFADTPENLEARKKVIKQGLFRLEDNTVAIDKSAVVDYYREKYCKPIARQISDFLCSQGSDTRRNRIEMAMSLVQDIPYGIPKQNDEKWHYGGLNTPPEVMIYMYGDCDSKAILFAGIMSYLVDPDDIVFLNQKNHLLTAIREKPQSGLTYVKYKGASYLIAETAGPGKRKLGEKGSYYSGKYLIEPLNINESKVIKGCD